VSIRNREVEGICMGRTPHRDLLAGIVKPDNELMESSDSTVVAQFNDEG
jgi:hypothetical protein